MIELSQKKKQILGRESLILSVTKELFCSQGYLGFSIDDVARAISCSKGTIYNHFPNKEEILIELVNRSLQQRNAVLSRVSDVRSGSREKVLVAMAVSELFSESQPHIHRISASFQFEGVAAKTSHERRMTNRALHSVWVVSLTDLVHLASDVGDLAPCSAYEKEALARSLCKLMSGERLEFRNEHPERNREVARFAANHLLNGCSWRPWQSFDQMRSNLDSIKSEIQSLNLQGTSIHV